MQYQKVIQSWDMIDCVITEIDKEKEELQFHTNLQ